jgi:dihydroorotate dehydrogenase electron transfer subunit
VTPPGGPAAADRVCRVVKRESLGGAYALLTFEHPEVARASAGQFAMVQPEDAGDLILRRPFSIMDTDPSAARFTIFLKSLGAGSRAVFDLKEGERARVLGPLGRGFTPPEPKGAACLVGGGYGVAPFVLFSRTLKNQGADFRLFYGGRSRSELPLVAEIERRGIGLTLSTDDGSLGERGRVTQPLLAALSAAGKGRLYACGPEPMMRAVARIASERDLRCEVSLDPWMGCGVGTCLGCVVKIQGPDESKPKNRPACTEGPVFDSKRVVWARSPW